MADRLASGCFDGTGERDASRWPLREALCVSLAAAGVDRRAIDVLVTHMRLVQRRAPRSFDLVVPPDSVALVVEGALAMEGRTARGRAALVELLSPGEWLYVPAAREARLLPHDRATLGSIALRDAVRLLDPLPGGAAPVLSLICAQTTQRLTGAAGRFAGPLRERVLRELGSVARRFGLRSPAGIVIDLPLRHRDLAGLVASTRASVTRCLLRLQREGRIARVGRRWRVHDDGPTAPPVC